MTTAMPRDRRRALFESRREREFYRYYEPIRALSDDEIPVCDLSDDSAAQDHIPVSSPDRALTAFCQLGALRLGTKRAMLFFFDSKNAYVLAEATRSLSLQNDAVHDREDELWLGHSIIPRGFSICEETVCGIETGYKIGKGPADVVHIIPDLSEDTQFCDRPYVTRGPKARFYAGVPITTEKGIKIGAFCCLGEERREGLNEKDIRFMKDMAKTVMTHLEMIRAKDEHERGTQMVTGLGAFVEGATSLREWAEEHDRRLRKKKGSILQVPTPRLPPTVTTTKHASDQPGTTDAKDATLLRDAVQGAKLLADISTPLSEPLTPGPPRTGQVKRTAADLRDHIMTSSVRLTFERAAHLIREAVDVAGATFIDAATGNSGGVTSSGSSSSADSPSSAEATSDAVTTGSEATSTEGESSNEMWSLGMGKPCRTLASSLAPDSIIASSGNTADNVMTAPFLKALLNRYPRGKVWNFNQQGDASSDDDSSEGNQSGRSDSDQRKGARSSGSDSTRLKKSNRTRINDGKEIQRLFPGVRTLAFIGMWDQHRSKWFSACVIWSYSPYRFFGIESEVNFLSAFCDVTMAEVHRLEAINSDKAKTDFVSSISHELRTPLHGVLGCTEALQQENMDAFSSELVSQIEVCGRTLLDIIDHVLDYSKINQRAPSQVVYGPDGRPARGRRVSFNTARRARLGGPMAYEEDVVLDEITEEVVEAATYSFCCGKEKQTILNRKISTIVDIDRSPGTDWRCRLPLGGWKRIVINLISNALKYTDEGYVRVSLKQEPVPGRRRKFNILLTVADSGRGMSKEYLKNHIFEAFSQEDSFVEGSGLGMSLVAKILRALGGHIEVQSEKGVGTTMMVVLPVHRSRHINGTEREGLTPSLELPLPRRFNNEIVAFFGFERKAPKEMLRDLKQGEISIHTGKELLFKSLHQSCQDLGLKARRASDWRCDHGDSVCVILEADLPHLVQMIQSGGNFSTKPVVLLCNSSISERLIRIQLRTVTGTTHLEYVSQPCGSTRFARAIRRCLESGRINCGDNDPWSHSLDATLFGKSTPPAVAERPSITAIQQYQLKRWPSDQTGSPPSLVSDGVSTGSSPSTRSPPISISERLRSKLDSDEGYFSTRSQSTGHVPRSPHVVIPIPKPLPESFASPPMSVSNTAGSPQPVAAPPTKKKVDPPDPSKGLSLLLVDDNNINLQLLVNYASKQGHRKVTATDGQEAVDAYKSACAKCLESRETEDGSDQSRAPLDGPFDVLLCDINMPKMNGFEATRLIRSFEQQHNIRPAHIVALTGMGSATAQQEAFSAGVDLFLTKPVRLKELTQLLARIREGDVVAQSTSAETPLS